MPTLTLSFAPHTRTADAAVRAPRKNLRVFGSDTARLLFAPIVSSSVGLWTGWLSVTGDRIDVLLRDSVGRLLAVEVELDCDGSHLAGPLQCMKYRSMLAYLYEKPS